MNIEDLPKISLGYYPTPLEKMTRLSELLGKGDLYIKRDDMTGPAFGGNKTRKLEYLLQDAVSKGCTAVLTIGGPQTNHGRTTVAAAIKLGLKPILVLFEDPPEYLSGNLALDAMMGTDIVFAGENIDEAVKAMIERYEEQGDKVYNIPLGGSDPIGALGYVMAARELKTQMESLGISPKYLVCAHGSMGTYSGLSLGARYFGAPFQVIGIPVSPPEDDICERTADFINRVSAHYELGVRFKPEDVIIHNGPGDAPYSGQDYNLPDPLTRKYMFTLAKTEGVILDPTYTGKAFRGFYDLLESSVIEPGSEPVFLHSGGAVAVWTKEHLDDMQQELFDNCRLASYER